MIYLNVNNDIQKISLRLLYVNYTSRPLQVVFSHGDYIRMYILLGFYITIILWARGGLICLYSIHEDNAMLPLFMIRIFFHPIRNAFPHFAA